MTDPKKDSPTTAAWEIRQAIDRIYALSRQLEAEAGTLHKHTNTLEAAQRPDAPNMPLAIASLFYKVNPDLTRALAKESVQVLERCCSEIKRLTEE